VNLQGKPTTVLVGKVVEGDSVVNSTMATLGRREDYDRLGSFSSNSYSSTWTWKGLLPYFKRALNFAPLRPDIARSSKLEVDIEFEANESEVHASSSYVQYGVSAQAAGFRTSLGANSLQIVWLTRGLLVSRVYEPNKCCSLLR
jgi:choline dehydrogenase